MSFPAVSDALEKRRSQASARVRRGLADGREDRLHIIPIYPLSRHLVRGRSLSHALA